MPKYFTFHFPKCWGFFSPKTAFAAVRQIQLIYNTKQLTVKRKNKTHFQEKKSQTQCCKHRVRKELYKELYIDTQKHSTKSYRILDLRKQSTGYKMYHMRE